MSDPERAAERNRAEQVRLYGATLADIFTQLTETYALSRNRLAEVLGLSAPMVSQLAGGRRLKIGNPSTVQRLQRLMELAPQVRAGIMPAHEALAELAAESPGGVLTRSQTQGPHGPQAVRTALRWAADPADLARAAGLLQQDFPRLAEVLRVYGAGSTQAATDHFTALVSGKGPA